ncbi:MAG: carbonic anhydrase [Undibacterium sp.]|nr:carbonic anhydrase [Opitutaceae bacterium]
MFTSRLIGSCRAVLAALIVPVALPASEHGASSAARTSSAAVVSEADQTAMSPAEALIRLQAGNARFLSGKRLERDWPAQVHETAHGQHPFASIASCMDSRTAVEQVFDLGLGDVFSIRLAGNVIDDDVLGSLEYAHKVAGAKLIIVLGHSHCGAMKGAADDVVLGNLTSLVARVKPAVVGVPVDGSPRTSKNMKFVDDVGRHVILAVRLIRERSPVLRQLHDRGAIDIIGGFYDIETGKVEFYRPLPGASPVALAKPAAPATAATVAQAAPAQPAFSH